jgi:methionine synthase II (cobalamin-independent)
MHLCWGNYEGPHHCDVPLAEIIDVVFAARPATISFEAANPRHAHEWTLFEQVKLPEGKTIIPGVIESKSNFIEHLELIAQRIARYANLVGRDNVIARSDCGFGTWVGQAAVVGAMASAARHPSRLLSIRAGNGFSCPLGGFPTARLKLPRWGGLPTFAVEHISA